jgi:hypothetical protein
MALTLVRIDIESETSATAVFTDADGAVTTFAFRTDGSGVTHPEEIFAEAYLAVPGPEVPQAHALARLMTGFLEVRAQPLPNGEDLANAWAEVGDELEHDWALQEGQ